MMRALQMGSPEAWRRLATAAAAVLTGLTLLMAPPPAWGQVSYWSPWNSEVPVTGALQTRLAYTDTGGAAQNLPLPQMPATAQAGLPGGLKSLVALPLLKTTPGVGGYFDQAWSTIRGAVCNQVKTEIMNQVNFSPNSAYNVRCQTNPKGVLTVTYVTTWENDQFQQVTGRRLIFDYWVPLNGATFYVTSPVTCHAGTNCGPEPTDPQYTASFTVHITVVSTSANTTSFGLPVTDTYSAAVVTDGVDGGDITGGLTSAAVKWAATLPAAAAAAAASGGTAGIGVLVTSTAKLLTDAIATGIAGVVDQHLRDEVSVRCVFISAAANSAAQRAGAQFDALFKALYDAQLSGLGQFNAYSGSDGSMNFALTYATPAKPALQNNIATSNGHNLIGPSIYAEQGQAIAGTGLTISAENFGGTYSNRLQVGWNRTVIGAPTSQVAWGIPGQGPKYAQTGALTYTANGLTPSTAYQFQVHECDAVTCAPLSDWLSTATQAGGTGDRIQLWLDADTATVIGSGPLSADGSPFTVNVTIPASATPGLHTLNAAVPGGNQARTTVNVCTTSGCDPSLGIVDTDNQQLYPATPPHGEEATLPMTVRGANFTSGQTVSIYLDTTSSPVLASATVDSSGGFQIQFDAPWAAPGEHTLIASQPGVGLLASQVARPAARSITPSPVRPGSIPIFHPNPIPFPIFGQPLQASLVFYLQALAQ